MFITLNASAVAGLPPAEQRLLAELVEIFNSHEPKNALKDEYYEGDISLSRVNLGIALPQGMHGLEIGCAWGTKAVDVLAARSVFDGFVGVNGEDAAEANAIAEANNLKVAYKAAARDQLKFGCTFATLSQDAAIGSKIRFHSPRSAAAIWNGVKGRIGAGLAIIDTAPDNLVKDAWAPSIINLYTDKATWVLRRVDSRWSAKAHPHKLGRPLMEPFIWNATTRKPFGRSRLNNPVRRLIDSYVRTLANASIGLEFSTTPQKYLLGVTDKQFKAISEQKFKQYVGSIIAATSNPETGENPIFGQLNQGNIQPHIQMLRALATQFSAITGLSVMDTGVVNDANPTSSDAIEAQTKSLAEMAEDMNGLNGISLKTIVMMALALKNNKTLEELPEELTSVVAKFKNPSTPSMAALADAAMKLATVRPEFAKTDVFLEMMNFDAATVRRIKGQERQNRGRQVLEEEFGA